MFSGCAGEIPDLAVVAPGSDEEAGVGGAGDPEGPPLQPVSTARDPAVKTASAGRQRDILEVGPTTGTTVTRL